MTGSSFADFRTLFADPPQDVRPEVRWWLAEGLHTDETLRTEIEAAHRLGFGGMEFLAMDEGQIDHARYGWGSEEWVHDSLVVVSETTARGMAVSFTSGTNWSNANLPTITPEHDAAAKELDMTVEELAAGQSRTGGLTPIDFDAPLPPSPLPGHRGTILASRLVAAVAARVVDPAATPPVLSRDSVIDLTSQVLDGALDWTAPADGDWKLFTYWSHGTGQTAEPSESVNYTVNYIDRAGVDAVIDYWDKVVLTPELRSQIAENPRTQMYMDSLELTVYGAGGLFWSSSLVGEFRTRRGYDITPWLPFLTRTTIGMAVATEYHYAAEPADALTVEKVRYDYVQTLTDLYIENMLRPFAAFLHDNGITLRSEISYGLPFELTRPGPEVDGIETESLEFGSQIDAYRLLAGPAHLFNKPYSSETGATSRNHILDHRFYDQMIATQFAAGVTKTVLHGWASPAGAEAATEWPGHEGMWPMFSERFDTRQPAAEFYPLWTASVARQQLLLRRGRPRIDVGILRTDHFVDNLIGLTLVASDGRRIPDEEAIGRMWMRNRENQWWQDLGMQDAGWSYEYFDPTLLLHPDVSYGDGVLQPDGPGYQALIVYQEGLDPDAAKRLLELARGGLRVLFVHGARELKWLARGLYTVHDQAASRTPGLDGRDDELAATIAELLAEPTVAAISDPAQTVSALRTLGVVGRSEFIEDNESVLTLLRDEGDLSHLFVYHFLYETGASTVARIALERAGLVYAVDPWSGTATPYAADVTADGRLVVSVPLEPGETAYFTVDHTRPVGGLPATETPVATLDDWQIAVESWDAGEPQIITEDRGLGYVSREVRFATAVTPLASAERSLKPWQDLSEVGPDVSGVGDYLAELTVTDDLLSHGRLVLDLGSTAGGLGSVSVNNGAPRGFDTSRPRVDITDQLTLGTNVIRIRTASSLNNRLLARGYYDGIPDVALELNGLPPATQKTSPHDHGLLGPVRLIQVS
jgi:hypothetical protein